MKKVVSLLMAVLMLTSLLAVPVCAGEDDGFNDGTFEWCQHEDCQLPTCTEDGYCITYEEPIEALGHAYDDDADTTCNTCGAVREVEPEEPTEGSVDNPIYVAMGMMAPTQLSLNAGESIYYQLKAPVFNGYSLIVYDLNTVITVDGVRYDSTNAYSPIDYGIKVELELTPMSPAIVGFHNETEEDLTEISLEWAMPVGTESDPFILENGENAITIPETYPSYFTSYVPTAIGEYTFSVSDYENFMVLVDTDGDLSTYDDEFYITEDYVFNCEDTYVPVYFILQPTGIIPDVTLTVTPPAKGTETNPYWLGDYYTIQSGANEAGDAMWPATSEGIWYTMDGGAFNETTLQVTGTGALTVEVNGTSWSGQDTLDVPLQLGNEEYSFAVVIKASGDVHLDIVFPLGTENNPLVLNKGENTLPLPEGGASYYATYTAEKDGVLVMTPNTVVGLGYAQVFNVTREDYENGIDFIYSGWIDDEGNVQDASEDNILKLEVSAGDVISVFASAGENEDFEILAMDLILTVAYEGELEITTQPQDAFVKAGEVAKATVVAEGTGLTYTWYVKNAGATKYSVSSIKVATYSVKMTEKVHGRSIYCVVTDASGNQVTSDVVVLRAKASILTESDTIAYAKNGAKASVKITALGDGLTYQWYIKNAGATKYSKSSVKAATYATTMSSASKDRRMYCIVKDKYGNTVQSKTFRLRESVSITKESATIAYAKNGAKASVKVTASGDGLTYTWYIKNAGATKYSKSSVKSATYSTTMSSASKDRRMYCIVKDKYGNTVQSKTFRLRESVSITTQPKTVTVKKNTTAKVTLKASGDGLTYTWYVKNAGSSKYVKSSIKTASYSVKMTNTTKNRQLYCVVTDKYGKTVKSSTVTLKMK